MFNVCTFERIIFVLDFLVILIFIVLLLCNRRNMSLICILMIILPVTLIISIFLMNSKLIGGSPLSLLQRTVFLLPVHASFYILWLSKSIFSNLSYLIVPFICVILWWRFNTILKQIIKFTMN